MTIFGITIVIILGISVVGLISNRFNILELLALAFPVGIGTQTFIMFSFNLFGITFSLTHLFVIDISITLLSAFLNYKRADSFQAILNQLKESVFDSRKYFKLNSIWIICFCVITYILYAISVKSMFWPTFASDSISSFDLLAKGISHEGTILNSIILEKRVGYGAAYPPLYTMSLAYAHMLGFEISKIVPTLFFISLSLSLYTLLFRLTNATSSLLFTLFAIASPELIGQAAINITNVPQALYSSIGVISFLIWIKKRESRYLFLSALLLGLNGFIRSEGVVYILPTLAILYLYAIKNHKIWKSALSFSIITLTPFLLWQIFFSLHIEVMEQYKQINVILLPNLDFEQIIKILKLGFINIHKPQYFGITFYAFVVAFLANIYFTIKSRDNLPMLFIILFAFFGYLAILNQFELKADTIENIINYSGKRFFFGIVLLMWAYIANSKPINTLFNKIENLLSVKNNNPKK